MWFWALIVILLLAIAGGMGSEKDTAPEQTESHIYDQAQVKDMMNGIGTEKIGEYSIVKVSSTEVTDEALADWYFNYVAKNDFNFCMILYSDKNDGSGVYSANGIIQKDVLFTEDENGDYSLSEVDATSHAITYSPTDDHTLVVIGSDE